MDYEFKLARQILEVQRKLISHIDANHPDFQAELAKFIEIALVVRCRDIDICMRTGRIAIAERLAAEIEPIFINEYF